MKVVLSIAVLLAVAALASAAGGKSVVIYAQEAGAILKDDYYTFTDDIVSGKKTIGSADGICHWLPAEKAKTRQICTLVHTLKEGSLSLVLAVGPNQSSISVVGGSGAYSKARGSVTVTMVKKGLRKYEYKLV